MRTTNPIYALVTNDLNQDQRMARICHTLCQQGYTVTLVGRRRTASKPLVSAPYEQYRLPCFFERGPLFYLEYTLRCIVWLLFKEKGVIWSVDSDSLWATGIIHVVRGMPFVWDAHEWFTEVPEVKDRPLVKWIWTTTETIWVRRSRAAVTVSPGLVDLYTKRFGIPFTCIMNVPCKVQPAVTRHRPHDGPVIYYQGMLNAGRGLEQIIKAMIFMPSAYLVLAGEGDCLISLQQLAASSPAADRISFVGWKTNDELRKLASSADIGINLLEDTSLSYRMSLANKFFDYMHAGLPSLTMDFEEYRTILDAYPAGITLSQLTPYSITSALLPLLTSKERLQKMREYARLAAGVYCWEKEEQKVIALIRQIHTDGKPLR